MPSTTQILSLLTAAAALFAPTGVSASLDNRHAARHQRSRAAARSARSNTMPEGWQLQSACLSDAASPNRLLEESSNFLTTLTPAVCAANCNAGGYVYAAVQDGHECWCSSTLATNDAAGKTLSSSSCNMPCAGDSTQMCGGYYALTLYSNLNSTTVYKSYSSKIRHSTTVSNAQTKTSSVAVTSTTSNSHVASTTSASTATSTSKYKLVENMSGGSFFSHFNFFTAADPTNGNVDYVSSSVATSAGLISVTNGQAIMRVDNKSYLSAGANRQSVRVSSKNAYATGLMLFDIASMPYGCSVWPAMWTVGDNWPQGGEIDIIEGVNNNTVNQLTLHTGTSTSCSTSAVASSAVSSSFMNKECASSQSADAGCGYQDTSSTAYGRGFNAAGGAVYALLIDANEGTTIWKFDRSSIPSDITSGSPNPSGWGTPQASWPSTDSCKTGDVISKQSIVFDITLCGGWASSDYPNSGCPGTCAEQIADPTNYNNAVWKVNSVKVFQ